MYDCYREVWSGERYATWMFNYMRDKNDFYYAAMRIANILVTEVLLFAKAIRRDIEHANPSFDMTDVKRQFNLSGGCGNRS